MTESANHRDQLARAAEQLTRVLSFFPRLDAKASVVLALDTAMLAYLASKITSMAPLGGWLGIAPATAVLLIGISIGFLYLGGSPTLEGGHQSLVYFRAIAVRTEAKFIDEFRSASEETYLKDLLGQVWRNSEILKAKYDHLKWALRFLGLAIIPWLVSIVTFALQMPARP